MLLNPAQQGFFIFSCVHYSLGQLCRLFAYSLLFYRLYNGNTVGQQFGPKCCRGDKMGCGISPDSDDGQVTVFFTKNGKEVRALCSSAHLSFQMHSGVCECGRRWAAWKWQHLWTLSTLPWGCTLWEKRCCWTWTPSGGQRRTTDRW